MGNDPVWVRVHVGADLAHGGRWKLPVTATKRMVASHVESAADISVPSERVRGERGGPPTDMCRYRG